MALSLSIGATRVAAYHSGKWIFVTRVPNQTMGKMIGQCHQGNGTGNKSECPRQSLPGVLAIAEAKLHYALSIFTIQFVYFLESGRNYKFRFKMKESKTCFPFNLSYILNRNDDNI